MSRVIFERNIHYLTVSGLTSSQCRMIENLFLIVYVTEGTNVRIPWAATTQSDAVRKIIEMAGIGTKADLLAFMLDESIGGVKYE